MWLLAGWSERYGATDWGRLFVVTAAAFGTLLTPFAITLNNHTVAACCTLFALYPALRIWNGSTPVRGCSRWPASSPPSPLAPNCPRRRSPRRCSCSLLVRVAGPDGCSASLPAAALPVAAFFLTNYLALGQWRPAYSEFGGPWYEYAGSHWMQPGAGQARHRLGVRAGVAGDVYVSLPLRTPRGLFAIADLVAGGRGAGPWIEVPQSSGSRPPQGGQEPNQTPGSGITSWDDRRLLSVLTLAVTVVVVGFYLGRPRWNYGGGTAGPRWLLWLTPLWLLALLPAVDRLANSRLGRGLALFLLAVSALSAAYALGNPWRHPWIYNLMEASGWTPY